MIVVIFKFTGSKFRESWTFLISAHRGEMIYWRPNFCIFSFKINNALQSKSILRIDSALKYAEVIDNRPVPAPRSTIKLFLISLNSNPAKYMISTAQVASIVYCSNSILGLTKVLVFWIIEIKSLLLIMIALTGTLFCDWI